jgi:hypothetical protein
LSPATPRLSVLLFVAALASGAWLILAAGPAPQLNFAADVAAYLDAVHRASLGQWLGRDYTAAIGPAAILPATLAMRLAGPGIQALVYGSALAWAAYGTLGWLAMRHRMSAWWAGGFALYVAATAAAPYVLDFGDWRVLSYGLLYNRLAWAAVCLLVPLALLPRRGNPASEPWASVAFGAGVAWIGCIKPNYLVIVAPLAARAFWLAPAPGRVRSLLLALSGAGITLLLIWLIVPFSPSGHLATLAGMAREVPGSMLIDSLQRVLRENVWYLAVLALLFALESRRPRPNRGLLLVTTSLTILAALGANIANCQYAEIPLWGALGFVLVGLTADHTVGPATVFVRLGGVALALLLAWQPAGALAYNFAWHQRPSLTRRAVEIASPSWRGLPLRDFPEGTPLAAGPLESVGRFAAWLNDGLALYARLAPRDARVASLDWVNPFPFATRTTPVEGDDIAWHVGRTIGALHHPDADRIAALADVIMEPRQSLQPVSLAFKRNLFRSALNDRYVLAGESQHWRLWLRRTMSVRTP